LKFREIFLRKPAKMKFHETLWVVYEYLVKGMPSTKRTGDRTTDGTSPLDLTRLRAMEKEKPSTKIGQVRQVWPEIQRLLAAGHRLKDICARLNEIGIDIGYARLSDYVNRLRREPPVPQVQAASTPSPTEPAPMERGPDFDPLFNVKRSMANRPSFDYKPFHPDDAEKLLGFKPRGD
jgi:hypothetical protein